MPALDPHEQHLVQRRIERQQALLELLRARAPRPTTAEQLAEALRVSTRTVERDVARLREAEIPLTVRPGPGGGLTFATAATPTPVALTAAEIGALLVALAAVGPWSSAAAVSARGKLLRALEPTASE